MPAHQFIGSGAMVVDGCAPPLMRGSSRKRRCVGSEAALAPSARIEPAGKTSQRPLDDRVALRTVEDGRDGPPPHASCRAHRPAHAPSQFSFAVRADIDRRSVARPNVALRPPERDGH
jgi:hypothetical protein